MVSFTCSYSYSPAAEWTFERQMDHCFAPETAASTTMTTHMKPNWWAVVFLHFGHVVSHGGAANYPQLKTLHVQEVPLDSQSLARNSIYFHQYPSGEV